MKTIYCEKSAVKLFPLSLFAGIANLSKVLLSEELTESGGLLPGKVKDTEFFKLYMQIKLL